MPNLNASLVTGLVGYWNMEGNADDTAGGFAGSANTTDDHGTLTGQPGSVVFTAGSPVGGQYAQFNNNAGQIVAGNQADVNISAADLSISAWFRVDAFDRQWQALIVHGEGQDYRISRQRDANNMIYSGGTADTLGSKNVNDGQWHHVAATTTHNGGTQLWIDGVSDGFQPGPASLTNNGSPSDLTFGANPENSNNRVWDGAMDDIAIWNRVLTPAEIGAIYAGGLAGMDLGALLAIPEPSALALCMLGAMVLLRCRRR